jgi:hypothetical protein
MDNVINTLGQALGLPVATRPGTRAGQKAANAYSVARAQWRDLREAVRQAVWPGLSQPPRVVKQYLSPGGPSVRLTYPRRVGEGLVGAYMAVARISGFTGGTWTNPDERDVHIQVLSADVWTGEDTVAEYSGTVADLR